MGAFVDRLTVMTEPLASLNGRLLPQSEAHLALNDAGFVFGATVTDLCRTVAPAIELKTDNHWAACHYAERRLAA